jgi:nucleotide-binding universal stress UspA family protein
MTYKTILLHVNDERRVAGLVAAAALLATRYEAHLIGLYVMPPVPIYGVTQMGAGIIKAGLATFREEAKRVRAAFEQAAKDLPFITEWRLVDARDPGVAETIMDHGRVCDLIIASQRDRDWDFSMLLDEPERLAIESGRPVLVVPHKGQFNNFGRRITVAWNGTREAARATYDSLPLLKDANNVRILWINPQDDPDAGDLPTAEIAASLARHGVKCEGRMLLADDAKVGDVLRADMEEDGSDLLVMGAYGRSRLREFIFGGATREVLRHMTVPVLMSH